MGNFSKVLRILIAIHFGIGGIALLFVLPHLGGMTDTEKVLTIVGLVLVVLIFVYNLACLIKDENIIWEAISNGSSGNFWSAIGRFFLAIPKGIWWAICGIGFLIAWPFKKLYNLIKNGSKNGGKEKKVKLNIKDKSTKKNVEKERKKRETGISLIQSQYYNKYGKRLSRKEAEQRYAFDERMRLEQERKERIRQAEEKRKQEEAERKRKEEEEKRKREEKERKEKEKTQKRIQKENEKAEKIRNELGIQDEKDLQELKYRIKADMADYIKSISLAEADARGGVAYSDAIDNLRKFIVNEFNSSGVTDVSADEMFDRKKRKFIGSEKWSYINTNYENQNPSSDLYMSKRKLAYFVKEAEEKGTLHDKLHIDNYTTVQRIVESGLGRSRADIEKIMAKRLGIEWQEAKAFVDENGNLLSRAKNYENDSDVKKAKKSFEDNKKKLAEYKKLHDKYTETRNYYEDAGNDSYKRVDRLHPYSKARAKLDDFCRDIRKDLLKNIKEKYDNMLSLNRQLAESALVLACKELDKDPKEIAKVLEIDYSGSDDGIE